MELLLEPSQWIILAVVGLIAGFVDAVVGGGGLLSIPALLTLGVPPHITLGTNKLAASFGSSTAALTYYRKNLFNPKLWTHAFISTAIGAVIGTCAVHLIDSQWLEKLLPILVVAIAIYTLIKPSAMGCDQCKPPSGTQNRYTQWRQGIPLGFYDGFAGPGIGAFWTLTNTALYKMPILFSCGLARAMTFTSNTTALIVFLFFGQVDIEIGLFMGLCMMLGSIVGARSAIKFGLPFIRPLFITMVLLIAANLFWSAWL